MPYGKDRMKGSPGRPALAIAAVLWLLVVPARSVAVAETVSATVSAVGESGTLILDDGTRVRLAGILLPQPGSPDGAAASWPHSVPAMTALRRLVLGREVSLSHTSPADRHGRIPAHLHLADGTWIQGALLESGLALVRTTPDSRHLAEEMLALESAARAMHEGVWRYRAYAVGNADDAQLRPGRFRIVEGRVAAVARVGRFVYLNFGSGWRTDFTARIPASVLNAFRDSGIDPLALTERTVRVRGWIHWRNGPAIELTHPEQIELPERTGPIAEPPAP